MSKPNRAVCAVLSASLILSGPLPASAQIGPLVTALPGSVPNGVSYQGRLEQNGIPVNGSRTMVFKLFDALSGGSVVWNGGNQVVSITQGLFNTVLAIPINSLTGGVPRFLEISVEGTPLTPREALQSVPYAMVAKSVEGTLEISNGGLSISSNPTASPALKVDENDGDVELVASGGRVGVGTASPLGALHIRSATRGTVWESSSGGANGKLWDIDYAAGSNWILRAVDDPYLTSNAAINISRTGTTINSVAFPNGNVGIGTTGPNVKLEVAGIGRFTGANAFSIGGDTGQYRVQTDTPNNAFGFLSSLNQYAGIKVRHAAIGANFGDIAPPASGAIIEGNVGIGTAGPTTLFDVNGDAQFGSDATKSTFSATGRLTFPAGYSPTVALEAANKGYVDTQVAGVNAWTKTGAVLAPTTMADNVVATSSLTVRDAAGIGASGLSDGTLVVRSTSTTPANPVLNLQNKAGAGLMRVQENGNVGIGTANPPATKFHLSSGTLTLDGSVSRSHLHIISDPQIPIEFKNVNAGSRIYTFRHDALVFGLFDDTAIKYKWRFTGAGLTDIALNESGGNVGIGMISPGTRLHMSSGIFTVDGTGAGLAYRDGTQAAGRVLTSDAAGNASWQDRGVPTGAVMHFNLAACPAGWSALVPARGRYLVGLPLAGTLAGAQGTPLTNLENRPAGSHNHNSMVSSNFGTDDTLISTAGTTDTCLGSFNAGCAVGSVTGPSLGVPSGTPAPFIQLLVCEKL